jgi:metal-sulfur cluster biosynthetic enzyme
VSYTLISFAWHVSRCCRHNGPRQGHRDSVAGKHDEGSGLFDDLVPRYNYLSDPFDDPLSASDSDDDVAENIDEQEIYGMRHMSGHERDL